MLCYRDEAGVYSFETWELIPCNRHMKNCQKYGVACGKWFCTSISICIGICYSDSTNVAFEKSKIISCELWKAFNSWDISYSYESCRVLSIILLGSFFVGSSSIWRRLSFIVVYSKQYITTSFDILLLIVCHGNDNAFFVDNYIDICRSNPNCVQSKIVEIMCERRKIGIALRDSCSNKIEFTIWVVNHLENVT